MTFKIKRSEIAGIPNFEVAIAHHASELRDWRAQMKLVADQDRQEAAGRKIPAIERYHARPRPIALRLIEECIGEDGNVDYVIEDDGPTAQQRLAARKQQLLMQVAEAEQSAIEVVRPIAKARLNMIREDEIRTGDIERRARIVAKQSGLMSRIGLAKSDPADIERQVAAERVPHENEHMARQDETRRHLDAIHRRVAEIMSEIGDLTADTIDAWSMPSIES